MSEYINRGELLNIINKNVAEAPNERCAQLLEAILSAPTADVVEVVRCKDCKHHQTLKDGGVQCERIDGLLMTKPNDYCSYGERSENGT